MNAQIEDSSIKAAETPTAGSPATHALKTKKPVATGEEGKMPFQFKREGNLAGLVLGKGMTATRAVLGKRVLEPTETETLSDLLAADPILITPGDYLLVTVRNDEDGDDRHLEAVAYVEGETGPEYEFGLFKGIHGSTTSEEDSVATSTSEDRAPTSRRMPGKLPRRGTGRRKNAAPAAPSAPRVTPETVTIILPAFRADALLEHLEHGRHLKTDARSAIIRHVDDALDRDVPADAASHEVSLTLSGEDAETFLELLRTRDEAAVASVLAALKAAVGHEQVAVQKMNPATEEIPDGGEAPSLDGEFTPDDGRSE